MFRVLGILCESPKAISTETVLKLLSPFTSQPRLRRKLENLNKLLVLEAGWGGEAIQDVEDIKSLKNLQIWLPFFANIVPVLLIVDMRLKGVH